MLEISTHKYKPLLGEKNLIMDIWGVAIKDKHMGKQLLHKMMKINELFGFLKGYRYAFCYASNFKTGKALEKVSFEKISEFDASIFECDGTKYFEKIEHLSKHPSLWMKKIEPTDVLSHLSG